MPSPAWSRAGARPSTASPKRSSSNPPNGEQDDGKASDGGDPAHRGRRRGRGARLLKEGVRRRGGHAAAGRGRTAHHALGDDERRGARLRARAEARRVGKEGDSKGRSRWSPYEKKQN